MAVLVRTWLGLAALGAGLIHLAVAAGAPPVLLAAFAALGAAEVAWGVAAFARSTVPLPRLAVAGAVLPTIVWVGTLFAGAGSSHAGAHLAAGMGSASTMTTLLPAGPMLAGTVLDLAVAVVLAVRLRRRRADAASPEPGMWAYLGGVLAGTGVIFAVTSIALGGTAVGQSAMHSMGH
jgi:hypothetical protein